MSDIQILCYTPSQPHDIGEVNLCVTNFGVNECSLNNVIFEFIDIELIELSTYIVTVYNEPEIVISCNGFKDIASYQCIFGSYYTIDRYIAEDRLQCRAPIMTVPKKNVTLEVLYNVQQVLTKKFHIDFIKSPVIIDVFPLFGWLSGGTLCHL